MNSTYALLDFNMPYNEGFNTNGEVLNFKKH